jgi:MarR family 2-MHQ and catechol resistance regulon transcriptional repressor
MSNNMPSHYQGSDQERLALETYIKLSRAASAVETRINQHLAEVQLSISQFGVLEALYHLGQLSQSELGRKILKSAGNMTLVIDNLEKRGLVQRERHASDRRRIRISLTTRGQALIEAIFPQHVAIVVREMSILPAEKQQQLATLCKTLGLGKAPRR